MRYLARFHLVWLGLLGWACGWPVSGVWAQGDTTSQKAPPGSRPPEDRAKAGPSTQGSPAATGSGEQASSPPARRGVVGRPPAPPQVAAPASRPTTTPQARATPPTRRPPARRALSPKARCVGFFRARKYGDAGDCFAALGRSLGPSAQLPPLRRYEKGQLFRNAAVAFTKEALLSESVDVASWLRERAYKLMQTYREERLCENNYRCRIALELETQIYKKIGYLQLSVVTNHKNSLVTLRGYRFQTKFQRKASLLVRPGTYKLRVVYPDEKEPRNQVLVLSAAQSKIVNLFPKVEQRNITKVSIGLYIAAGVLLAGGGALAGVGTAQWFLAEQKWGQSTTLRSQKPVLEEQRSAAQPMIWAGASGAGVGLVLLILGFAFHTPPQPPKANLTPPALRKPPVRSRSTGNTGLEVFIAVP